MTALEIVALAIPGLLLIAAIAGLIPWIAREPQRQWPIVSIASALAAVAAAIVLLALFQSAGGPEMTLAGPRWLTFPGVAGFDARWALVLDPLALYFLFAVTAVGSLIASAAGRNGPPRAATARLPTLWALATLGVVILLTAADLVQFFFGWQLAAWCGFALVGAYRTAGACLRAARRMLIVHLGGDVLLVLAICLLWQTFGSLRWETIHDPEKLGWITAYNPVALSGAGLCLLGAVVARCGQFPLLVWWGGLASAPAFVGTFTAVVPNALPGLYLLMRGLPTFARTEAVTSLMLLLGAVTILSASAIAAAQEHPRRTAFLLMAATLGWGLLGLGCDDLASDQLAGSLVLTQLPLLAVVALSVQRTPKSRARTPPANRPPWQQVIAAIVVALGLGGQGALLSYAWELASTPQARPIERPVAASSGAELAVAADPPATRASEPRASIVVPIAATLGMVFSAFALVSLLLQPRRERADQPTATNPAAISPASNSRVLTGLLLLALLLFAVLHGREEAARLLDVGIGLPAALLGAALAYIAGRSSDAGSQRLRRTLAPLGRLSRNQFYLDDLFDMVVNKPLRISAIACTRIERLQSTRRTTRLEGSLAGEFAARLQSLRNGQMQLATLAFLLSLGGLLCVFIWWGN